MKKYVQAWVYPMAGYKDLDELMQSLDTSLTDQEKQETAVKILMPVENRLRLMLGLAEASETADLWCLEVQNSEDVPEETEESKETDETSMSESETEAVSPRHKQLNRRQRQSQEHRICRSMKQKLQKVKRKRRQCRNQISLKIKKRVSRKGI